MMSSDRMGGLRRAVKQLRQVGSAGQVARLRQSLRFRVALGIGLPILLILSLLSLVHYWRERHLLEDQARLTAEQIGQVIIGSLRQSMIDNDPHMVDQILTDIRARRSIDRAQIIDLNGHVLVDSGQDDTGLVQRVAEPGCTTCHRLAPENRPATAVVGTDVQLIRVAVPIFNEPDCAGCHETEARHLGILLVEVPMAILWPNAVHNLKMDLGISAGLTVLLTAGVSWLLHRLVVRRVEAFRRPLAAYAAGNFETRLAAGTPADEVDQLALTFNRMADQLEQQAREQQARSELRQRAIVEERERIARELHDGLAQVLGYVHTKATAVRLLLARGQLPAAERQLAQMEEAARGLFVDVREAILGLRMTSRPDMHLPAMLREYARHFSELADLPVEVEISPSAEQLSLPLEAELQLLRIVQEALANVRKHANAHRVHVYVANGGPLVELAVCDDGQGFEPEQVRSNGRPHFGLGTMRERAEAIGAEFALESRTGSGTRVVVRMPAHPS